MAQKKSSVKCNYCVDVKALLMGAHGRLPGPRSPAGVATAEPPPGPSGGHSGGGSRSRRGPDWLLGVLMWAQNFRPRD